MSTCFFAHTCVSTCDDDGFAHERRFGKLRSNEQLRVDERSNSREWIEHVKGNVRARRAKRTGLYIGGKRRYKTVV
jgi:hypothetical protein